VERNQEGAYQGNTKKKSGLKKSLKKNTGWGRGGEETTAERGGKRVSENFICGVRFGCEIKINKKVKKSDQSFTPSRGFQGSLLII